MKKVIVSVYDEAAETYSQPYFEHSLGSARRAFQDAVNNPESAMNKHPEHFTCFLIGYFDFDTASIQPVEDKFILVGRAHELLLDKAV